MENQASMIAALFEKTERCVKLSTELYKLKAIKKSADVISTLTARLAVISFIILFYLILNVGVALWLGELFGKTYFGFFVTAGFHALVGILLYLFRNKWIKEPLRNSIITQSLS